MADITEFKLRGNRIDFKLDGEKFTAKYPDEYDFDRSYLEVSKEFPLALWANKVAFEKPSHASLDFDVSQERLAFWTWIAQKVHELDVYQSLSDEFDSEEIPLWDVRDMEIEVGSDGNSLVPTTPVSMENPEGALISQSPGKESVASKLICDELGVSPVLSVFIEYSSRAATHKIAGREEYNSYFNNDTARIWSNFNELQTTLQDYTENYEPITCFWEIAYVTMELLLAIKHNRKFLLVGNQLNTGEAMHDPKGRFTTFEELNQSYIFELAYTDYLNDVLDVPITHASNVRPFTGYTCRKIIADREPGFLKLMQNCLRPNSKRRWCGKCYKCADAWVEFMGCGMNPLEAGLTPSVLMENPHLGAEDTEDWGFSFPRYDRNEQIWREDEAYKVFRNEVAPTLMLEEFQAFDRWRSRQRERVSEEDVEHIRKFNGKFIEPVAGVVPEGVLSDMGMPHGDFVEESLDPHKHLRYYKQWRDYV